MKSYDMIPRPVVSLTVTGTVTTEPGAPLTFVSAAVTGGVPVAVAVAPPGVPVAVAVGVNVGVGDGPPREQVKSAVSNISDQPPSIEPTLVAVSSTINKFQVPFIAEPAEP